MIIKKILKKISFKPSIPNVLASQWYSNSQIKAYQEKHLRKLIHYAYHHTTYYQQVFDEHGIKPRHIKHLADLKLIPRLSRKTAIDHYDALVNPHLTIKTHLSSETSGQRLRWAYSKEWQELFGKTLWRGFSWAGLRPDKRVVSFYSRVIGEITSDSLIIREAFDLNRIQEDLERIKNYKPQFAYCYSSSAFAMAQYLLKTGSSLPLEGVIVTSEQLLPHYIPVIEKAFQCKVFNNYGCNDGGAWGAECHERSGLHQDFERSIIEFDDNGRMLVTDLWNYGMPFIRYENGDAGEWLNKTCRCGRAMPLFKVTGRVSDHICTPTQIFAPTTVSQLLKYEYFADIQVIQHSTTHIEIFYVRNPQYALSQCQEILAAFVSHLENIEVTITETDFIPKPASEKRRICINKSNRTLDNFFA